MTCPTPSQGTYIPPQNYPHHTYDPNSAPQCCLLWHVVKVPLKIIAGLGLCGIAAALAVSVSFTATATSFLFAVGNPSCLCAGIITVALAVIALTLAHFALKVFWDAGSDIRMCVSPRFA